MVRTRPGRAGAGECGRRARGLRVPGDLSGMGFDDIDVSVDIRHPDTAGARR